MWLSKACCTCWHICAKACKYPLVCCTRLCLSSTSLHVVPQHSTAVSLSRTALQGVSPTQCCFFECKACWAYCCIAPLASSSPEGSNQTFFGITQLLPRVHTKLEWCYIPRAVLTLCTFRVYDLLLQASYLPTVIRLTRWAPRLTQAVSVG